MISLGPSSNTLNGQKSPKALYISLKGKKFKTELRRGNKDMDPEDIRSLQLCLGYVTGRSITHNGEFGHHTENLVKIFQEKNGLVQDGVVTEFVWDKMSAQLDKSFLTKEEDKEKSLKEVEQQAEENRRRLKNKQNLEALAILNKLEQKTQFRPN